MKYFLIIVTLAFSGIFYSWVNKHEEVKTNVNYSVNQTDTPSLRLVYQHPVPVITIDHPDALNNKFGFEGGTVVKIDSIYHLFTSEMVDNPMWVKMRLAHWKSSDRINWERVSTIRESSGEFNGVDPRAALWSPMVVFDSTENRWNLFYIAYNAAPSTQDQRRLNMNGKVYRSVSEVQGKNGIFGPFIDQGIILSYDEDSDPWEGLQGISSFYPYQIGEVWYAFYGSCNNVKTHVKMWLVGYAKSETGSIGGPWKRLSERNPSQIEKVFIENPIVSRVDGGYLVIYDSKQPDAMGWAYSMDGINWNDGQPLIIQNKKGEWAKNVRTVLGLINEGDGKYTVFYTGFEENPDWDKLFLGIGSASCAIGFVELEIQ